MDKYVSESMVWALMGIAVVTATWARWVLS
jgi:hypothetical protein